MKKSMIASMSLMAMLAWATSSFSGGQSASAPPQAIARTHDGKPDFTGVWAGPAFTHTVGPNDTEAPAAGDIEPTWMGDSVGKWEGDTLVIDTIGVKEWALDDKIHFPAANGEGDGSHWHSGALHVVERLRYTGPRTASYQVTIDDPEYLTAPWTQDYHVMLHPTWTLLEFVCEENNRCREGKCVPAIGQ